MPKYRGPQVTERLGRVGEERRECGQGGVNVGEHLLEGAGSPAERVGDLVPLGNELVKGLLQGSKVGEVGGAEALASEDAEPLLDGVHPGAMDRGEVGN